jgi:transcriptional regulator with XRE-family HTH domain
MEVHEQLRQARERRGFTLEDVHNRIGVRLQVLMDLERGAYGALPSGLYGRHAVRAYARTVGLDADAILESVGQLLPEPEDPLDGLARVRGFSRKARAAEPIGETPEPVTIETAQDDWSVHTRRVLAAAIDGAVLLGVAVGLVALTVAAAGTSLTAVAPVAAPAWIFLIGLVSALYFALLGGIARETVGARFAGVTRRTPDAATEDDRRSDDPSGMQRAGPVPAR